MEKLKIVQGSTLIQPVRWGIEPFIYRDITGVVDLSPLRFTVPNHQMPNGWKHEILSVKGMTQINSTQTGKATDYHFATVVDPSTIELNDVNAADWPAYVAGTGVVRFYTPADLTNQSFDLYIWDRVDGNLLLHLSSGAGDIEIDAANYVVTINMTAAATAALTWKKGVYALKATDSLTDVVLEVVSGNVQVEIE